MRGLKAVFAGAVAGAVTIFSAAAAFAAWPERPVQVIVPWAAGGGTDATGRIIAKMLQDEFKKPFNVVNRTGGGGVVGHAAIAQAPADGYTIGVITIEIGTFKWLGQSNLSGSKDFTPIALYNFDPGAFYVSNNSPFKNAKEVVAALKANPKVYKLASGSAIGGAWHMAFGSILLKAGVDPGQFNWIPSQGAAPALQELLAGGTDIVPCSLPEAKALLDAGRIRAMAVAGDQRLPAYPNVPTAKEALGVDVLAGAWRGIGGPKGMPAEATSKLVAAMEKIHKSEEFRKFMTERGFGLMWRAGPDFAKFMDESEADSGKVLKAIGLSKAS
ncbi:MAG: tripartite tricarboxylate transporter substrate binding protein [Ferrovibrio sp.]|uniref:tripartite tricarboxylate transporter substrate binding protein n=1 Tax=Ferrovibrio sp. TaxID=1917215 RepID=UPI00391B2032